MAFLFAPIQNTAEKSMARKIPKWRQERPDPRYKPPKKKATEIQGAGITGSVIAKLKSETPSKELYSLITSLKITQVKMVEIQGEPFPNSLDMIFKAPVAGGHATLVNEIIWGVTSALPHGRKLKDFIDQKRKFELSIILNEKDEASEILNRCEEKFGWSVWLMQNRLALAQFKDGVEEKRRLAASYETQVSEIPLLRSMLYFIANRIEGTAVPGYLQSELSSTFEGAVYKYLKSKIIDLSDTDINSLALVLNVDSRFSAIDHYESIISALQTIVVIEELVKVAAQILTGPIQALFKTTCDRRLIPILIAMGVMDPKLYRNVNSKVEFIEAYSQGHYAEALKLGENHVAQNADDMGALVMLVRTETRCGETLVKHKGLLGEIAQHLKNIILLGSDTYSSALSLYAFHDRFFGHSWTTFLRGIVNLELASDKFQYPSIALKRILALEPLPTPFTALLQPITKHENHLIKSFRRTNLFSSTIEVFKLATYGFTENASKISEERRRRYLGSYALSSGNYQSAIENFEWLIENSTAADSMRASAAASIAYIRNENYLKSIETLVTGYLQWPHAPTTLPLQEIVERLEAPENWPDSISLPLIFELYTSYCDDDKITHLRYAFEQFQINNDLTSPSDLKERMSEFGIDKTILYLSNVWRPEVMRQTVLYEGTRQIEEERIKVCQALAEVDIANSAKHLLEIRERVKSLEIAKATNLVEQSKVYVDVAAIKKALKTKLGDSYARYKSIAPTVASADSEIMDVLSNALSQSGSDIPVSRLMSSLHIISKHTTTSEIDLQFAAMFAEVTNEFLRGDHGLNAYLSTRVRHGKLSNALRKPAADEFLVTERKEGSVSYVPNLYWIKVLTEINEDDHEKLTKVLEDFASTLDSIITFVKDNLIQIRITHELISKDTNQLALFAYQTSNLERMYMQASDANAKSLDEFIDLCVETLWDKTDLCLVHVQQVLRTDIRQKISNAFDDLHRSLSNLEFSDKLGEITNHVFRARTNTQAQLNNVASWFKRSEVYDRQDYSIEFPVEVATNMIRNTISGAHEWKGVALNILDVQGMMPGRSLDAMVDVFCVLFENAIEHSGETIQDLRFSADLRLADGYFKVILCNSILPARFAQRDESRLERIRSELTKTDSRSRAQKEGRSGFHKLWSTINAPQYSAPLLRFEFKQPNSFEVEVSFKTEVRNNESTDN